MAHKVISHNRQARFLYTILETFEAGIVLQGYEVKSIRAGEVNLKDGFVRIERDEAYLLNAHIAPYRYLSQVEYDPLRRRKLLLNKQEIERLRGKSAEKGLAIIPLEIYINDKGFIKIAIGLGKGKKHYEKRESIKKKETARELRREFGGRHSV